LCEKQKTQICFEDNQKKHILEVTVIIVFFVICPIRFGFAKLG